MIKTLQEFTDKELLEEYHELRDIIEGRRDGGYGSYELHQLSRVEREMDRREEEDDD